MIRGYRHKGLQLFADTWSKARIQPAQAKRSGILLAALDVACKVAGRNAPGYGLHPLHVNLEGHWAVRVSGNWRVIFAVESEHAILVDYQDYHFSGGFHASLEAFSVKVEPAPGGKRP
jgi:proteic killer suppression protein